METPNYQDATGSRELLSAEISSSIPLTKKHENLIREEDEYIVDDSDPLDFLNFNTKKGKKVVKFKGN